MTSSVQPRLAVRRDTIVVATAVAYSLFIPLERIVVLPGGRTLGLPIGASLALIWLWWRRGAIPKQTAFAGCAILVGYFALSQLWAPAVSFYGVSATAFGLASAFILADVIGRVRSAGVAIALGFLAGTVALAAYSLAAHGELLAMGARLPGLDGQTTAHLAAVLALGVIAGCYIWVAGTRIIVRFISAAGALFLTWPLLLTQTRAAWLAALVSALVLLVWSGRSLQFAGKWRKLSTAAVATGVILVGWSLGSELIEDRARLAVDTGGSGRTAIWQGGMMIFETAPFFGVGYRGFPGAYTEEVALRAHGDQGRSGRAPHSILVSVVAEGGVIGGILLGLATWMLWRRGAGRSWPLTAPLIALGLAGVVQALFIDLLTRKYFWWAVAFLAVPKLPESHGVDPETQGVGSSVQADALPSPNTMPRHSSISRGPAPETGIADG